MTLGALYAQPPLTQDANVAKDGSMMRTIERVPHEEGEAGNALPSTGRQMRASADISVEAAGANLSEGALPEPPTAPMAPIVQEESEAAQAPDLAGVTRALNVRQIPSPNVVADIIRVKSLFRLKGCNRA